MEGPAAKMLVESRRRKEDVRQEMSHLLETTNLEQVPRGRTGIFFPLTSVASVKRALECADGH